jgi:hypothetical protein
MVTSRIWFTAVRGFGFSMSREARSALSPDQN